MGLEGCTFYMILTNVKLQFSNQPMKNHILSTIQGGYVKSDTNGISTGDSSSAYGYGDSNDNANTVDVLEEDNMSMRAGIKPGEAYFVVMMMQVCTSMYTCMLFLVCVERMNHT